MEEEIQYPKLPEEFKTRWLAALRSGEYKQGQGELQQAYELDENNNAIPKTGAYCCLGVALEICGGKGFQDAAFIDGNYMEVPDSVPESIQEENPLAAKLANLNDGEDGKKGLSFLEIADWIEENV